MMKGYMLFVYLCIVYQEFYYTSAQDINECEQNPCKNGGKCTNGVNMFTCNCDGTGYSGTTCETDIDECNTNPCQNGGACIDGVNGYTCNCVAGYTDTNCGTDINDCSPNVCQHGGTCRDGVNGYTCNCAAGYTDTNCGTDIDECSSNPCQNRGTCIDGVNRYTCNCVAGYTDTNCQTDIDECSSNPCQNGGTCINGLNSYTCNCVAGYTDTNCQADIDECSSNPCQNGGTCINRVNRYTCNCVAGYTDTNCQAHIDECTQGTHRCDVNADCTNTIGSYTCKCRTGYTGDGRTCSDVDECSTNGDNCHNNADCSNTQGSFICTCKPGYTGNGEACSDINECASGPCKNGGACTNLVNAYSCSCTNGYSGKNCQVASLGALCSQSGTTCADSNARCQSNGLGGNTCRCTNSYYDSDGLNNIGGTCTPKVDLGYNCPMPNACFLTQAECVGNTCRCTDIYYDTNTDSTIRGTCETRRNLGASCSNSHSNSKQCVDQNASCRGSSYICSCNDRYHQDGTICKPNVALGGSCQGGVDNECSDLNADCINSKCTCSVGFYWFNKGSSQSNCRAVEELQVTGITFTKVETTEFTVSWTAPTRPSYVSGYDVEWQSGGKVVDARSPQRITSLTPGKMYVVKVISKDTATQPDDTRETYTSKQQAAKPSIPGPVTSSENDLDARDRIITIRWTSGTGEATLYRVKLFDGDTQKGSRDTSSLSITFNNVLNGYRYNVRVTARSQQFNGDYLWSETKVSPIKTKVQVPEAPRNGVCKSPSDSAITLDWDAPSRPNGDLVRYHIDVINTTSYKVLFRDKTMGTETQKVVGNLQPGTNYIFRLYTENEGNISTNYDQVSSACKTRAKMSMKPENLNITNVTSRSFLITWDKPINTYSAENYGYVLQVKDDEGACKEEVLYKCSDCKGSFQVSKLSGLCDQNKQPDFTLSKAQLASQLSYNASLNPDTNYTVTVTAINNEGRGHPATMTQRTKEEAPQTPYGVKVVGMTATTFDITWNINGPRPGQTIFVIILTADAPAESKNFTATGFALREYKAFGLQEYWNYSVAVMASTSIGSSKSAVTNEYRTLPAAPGKVSEFSIEPHPDEDFTKMKISWKMPNILERNGVIKSYRFENNEPGNVTATTNFQQNHPCYTYTKTVYVVPEEKYTFRVYAINEQHMEGEHIMVTKTAPPGVPLNIEESLKMDVIDLQREKTVTERQITITLVREFFEESTNGKVQTTGILVCVNICDFEGVMTITDVNAMENWAGASKKGSTSYRATNSDWLDKATVQYTCGRNKREVTNIEYIVGSEDCTNISLDEFCNGPLQPGTSYKFVAFTCTNGGCLLSRQYGPFTSANTDSHCSKRDTANSHDVIVGVVLGLIIIILLLYAGYATYLIRRYRAKDEQEIKFGNKKDRKSQTYVNEIFMTGSASNTSGNFNVDSGVENVYSRLDDNVREDKTTYESLSP